MGIYSQSLSKELDTLKSSTNFYPTQYQLDNVREINHNYLLEQFQNPEPILDQVRDLIKRGDYTLGEVVDEFERVFSEQCGAAFGIGVGSGTDALFLALKATGIGQGDEVITTPYTFYATISAIVRTGAKPVFVDIGKDYNINAERIPDAITQQTKAIMPVHWSGNPCDVIKIKDISEHYKIPIIADACHAIGATYDSRKIGEFADISCFSLHPLKNLNVWGDGGVMITDNVAIADNVMKLRNHGLVDRDTCERFAYNSRLDSLQAIVANYLIKHQLQQTTDGRVYNAAYLDERLKEIEEVKIPDRNPLKKHVFHLYMGEFKHRDELKAYLLKHDIDAKVHYPIPMHLQPAARFLNHRVGDFPMAERIANNCLSLPVHEFLNRIQLDRMINTIKDFYQKV